MCLTETRIYFVIYRNLCHFHSNGAIPLLPGDEYAMVAHSLHYEPNEDFQHYLSVANGSCIVLRITRQPIVSQFSYMSGIWLPLSSVER